MMNPYRLLEQQADERLADVSREYTRLMTNGPDETSELMDRLNVARRHFFIVAKTTGDPNVHMTGVCMSDLVASLQCMMMQEAICKKNKSFVSIN